MVTHHVLIAETGHFNVTLNAAVLRVTHGRQLPAALAQRTKQVVIESDELERRFFGD